VAGYTRPMYHQPTHIAGISAGHNQHDIEHSMMFLSATATKVDVVAGVIVIREIFKPLKLLRFSTDRN